MSSDQSSIYVPVSCQFHSELELVIIQKKWLSIRYKNLDDKSIQDIIVKPYDIITNSAITNLASKNKGEFLRVINNLGQTIDIRLDHITCYQSLDSVD